MTPRGSNPWQMLKGIYKSEFEWSVLKSMAMFFLGVRIAKELVGVDIMPAIAQH